MLSAWIHEIKGLVRLQITGYYLERFLNLCSREDIRLYYVKRVDIDCMRVSVTVSDFRRLRAFARRSRCRVHIVGREGAPFFLRRFRRRYALWGGAVLFLLLLYILSSRIWVIEMTLGAGIDGRELMRNLEDLGVRPGVASASVDVDKVRQELFKRMDGLSYVMLNIMGNQMEVLAQPRTLQPEILDENAITDIVAAQDGVLTKLDVRGGTALKKVGEAVLKGEVLVTALMEPTKEEALPRLVHSMAEVEARTWRKTTRKLSLMTKKKAYTGTEHKKYALLIGKTRINLYLGSSISRYSCDKISKIDRVRLSEYLSLPVALITETYIPYDGQDEALPAGQVELYMQEKAQQSLKGQIKGEIKSITYQIEEQSGAAVLTAKAECLEDIGAEVVDERKIEDVLPKQGEEQGKE